MPQQVRAVHSGSRQAFRRVKIPAAGSRGLSSVKIAPLRPLIRLFSHIRPIRCSHLRRRHLSSQSSCERQNYTEYNCGMCAVTCCKLLSDLIILQKLAIPDGPTSATFASAAGAPLRSGWQREPTSAPRRGCGSLCGAGATNWRPVQRHFGPLGGNELPTLLFAAG